MGLVDDWEASRRERTWLKPGERDAVIERDLDGQRMTPEHLMDRLRRLRREEREARERERQPRRDPDRGRREPEPDDEWEAEQ